MYTINVNIYFIQLCPDPGGTMSNTVKYRPDKGHGRKTHARLRKHSTKSKPLETKWRMKKQTAKGEMPQKNTPATIPILIRDTAVSHGDTSDNIHSASVVELTPSTHKCVQCEKEFRRASTLRDHIQYVHHSSLACTLCTKSFTTRVGLTEHTRRVHQGCATHRCTLCGQAFSSKTHYTSHMNKHNDIKGYACQICGRQYHHKCSLKAHIPNCKGPNPAESRDSHLCSLCGKMTLNRRALLDHMKGAHTDKHRYTCPHCGRGFNWRSGHHKHVVICQARQGQVEGEPMYRCDRCGRGYQKRHSLEQHYKQCGETYHCTHCTQEFKGKKALAQHIQGKHAKGPSLVCHLCGKGFTWRSCHRTHVKRCKVGVAAMATNPINTRGDDGLGMIQIPTMDISQLPAATGESMTSCDVTMTLEPATSGMVDTVIEILTPDTPLCLPVVSHSTLLPGIAPGPPQGTVPGTGYGRGGGEVVEFTTANTVPSQEIPMSLANIEMLLQQKFETEQPMELPLS